MDQSIGSIVAVIASTVLTARIITGQSNERALSRTPTDFEIGYYGEILPYFLVQACQLEFFTQDGVRFANSFPGGHE